MKLSTQARPFLNRIIRRNPMQWIVYTTILLYYYDTAILVSSDGTQCKGLFAHGDNSLLRQTTSWLRCRACVAALCLFLPHFDSGTQDSILSAAIQAKGKTGVTSETGHICTETFRLSVCTQFLIAAFLRSITSVQGGLRQTRSPLPTRPSRGCLSKLLPNLQHLKNTTLPPWPPSTASTMASLGLPCQSSQSAHYQLTHGGSVYPCIRFVAVVCNAPHGDVTPTVTSHPSCVS